MSGHSKWANIKHKKEATDKKKGQAFSRLAKEIMVATKQGGKDPASNIKLRMALASAKASNMPRENIERAIKKGAGELGDVAYEEITYEGYGPAGTAFVVECLTENRNRTIGDVRMTFDRNGGNLAASGAVSWMFQRKAHFIVEGENADEDKLMELTLEAGAEDRGGSGLDSTRSRTAITSSAWQASPPLFFTVPLSLASPSAISLTATSMNMRSPGMFGRRNFTLWMLFT